MATYIIFINLLFVLFVLHLPCPLTAKKPDYLKTETIDDLLFKTCYKPCAEQKRFPCLDGSGICGTCIGPFYEEDDGQCVLSSLIRENGHKDEAIAKALEYLDNHQMIKNNDESVQKILDVMNKRDEGTGGIVVDTGNGQPPSPPRDGHSPPGANQEQEADVGAEGNQADTAGQGGAAENPRESIETYPSDDFLESNAEVEAHQAQNNGSVILLAEWQFILIVVGCVAVAIIGVAIAFICWYKIQTTSKAQNEADYPAYGVTGPGAQVTPSMNNGDRKLAQSAQMYHYQHQKQQMIAMEKREKGDVARDASDYDSEEENEDGDLTVYECPGLAPTGEMQVKNPLFAEDAYTKQGGEAEGEEKQ